jgi:hypothetical protein
LQKPFEKLDPLVSLRAALWIIVVVVDHHSRVGVIVCCSPFRFQNPGVDSNAGYALLMKMSHQLPVFSCQTNTSNDNLIAPPRAAKNSERSTNGVAHFSTISIGAIIVHFRLDLFVRQNPLLALAVIPALIHS